MTVDAGSARWNEITPSAHAPERAALRHVRDLLPDRHPYQAWSNFTFVSDQGHIREVDLLVAAPTGLFLVEIKNFRGPLSNSGATWVLSGNRTRTLDSPVPLADQKAKELKSLLDRAAVRERGVRVPFLRGCVFLADPGMECRLEQGRRDHLYVPDDARAAGMLGRIGADLLLGPIRHAPPSNEFFRALPRLLATVGVHRTRRSVSVGPWRIEPRPYDSGPTWQDHRASREDLEGEYRRIRIYLYERESDPQTRESVRGAAEREYLAGRGIDHPGLLVPTDLLQHDHGPALVIDQHPDARRLDHYLAGDGRELDLPARLDLVRQLADAVRFAHDRRLVHRALSPRAIVVEPDPVQGWRRPRLRVGEWQSAARGLSSSATTHRVVPTTHAGRHVEAAAEAYLAPEFTGEADGTVAIDVFGVGSTAYLILTGRPPAAGRAELAQRLAAEGGLRPSAVDETLPADLDAVIALATDPRVADRYPDLEALLDDLAEAVAAQAPDEPVEDPWEATAGAELPEGYRVRRVLGTGATARAFLVERDGLESVLKVGRSAQSQDRLADEATVLEGLRHEHLVGLRRGVFPLGNRHAIELDNAGDQTLAQLLRAEESLLPDQLQRFGDQLLDVIDFLGRHDTFHRDVKPENLGVRRHPKRGPALVLFDFSLAGASASDTAAGTRGYRDPFLGSDRRPVYDEAAELYAVAATLHEMASLELPAWGEDGTDPRFGGELTVSAELFDAGLREPLTAFFRRALHRDAAQRFGTAGALREAWNRVFTTMDAQAPARTSHTATDDPQESRDAAADAATADTALDAAGLSLRAVAVAQRLGAETVGTLLAVPTRELWRARGLSRTTRLELVNRVAAWRRRLGVPAASPAPDPRPETARDLPPGLDAVAARLLPDPAGKGADPAALVRLVLGMPDAGGVLPAARWPTLTEVGAAAGLTRARIGQILAARRRAWIGDPVLVVLRDELVARLRALNRVAAAGELVAELLAARGCGNEEDPARRLALGYAVLRAIVEADGSAEEPLLATRRHRDRVLVALQVAEDEPLDTPGDAQLLDMAAELGDEAVRLAATDPLPTPRAVVRALAEVAARHDLVPAEQRLVALAAAASGSVLVNARLEVYPRDLDPVRALRLSQAGAGVPAGGISDEALRRRVAARFPGLAPLPRGRALAGLLADADFDLRWDGEHLVPPGGPDTRSSTRSGHTGTGHGRGGPAAAADGGPDARLRHVLDQGGTRLVTVRRSGWAAARDRAAAVLGVEPVDASAAFVGALREVARERRISDFDVVLRADAPDADSRARTNLGRVIAQAWDRLESTWMAQPVLLLDALTPFGRYEGGMALLDRLLAAARTAGRDGGPRTLVLLCPAQDEQQPPRIGTHVVGLTTGEEWVVAPSRWATAA
ncbi:BREX system serine/threonine kinase PglW [Pseudonocardia sp.]|uniref:BREX system serine/threonine kinase PglW n=1 Tax=Pseudonocardia sp. TaxID=60912 RepID=UPI00262AF32A|nr:BREX system serine/threonine kinase PglW [Pseudonocardia sp.]